MLPSVSYSLPSPDSSPDGSYGTARQACRRSCGLDRYMAAVCDRSLAPNSPRCLDLESRLRRNNRFWTRERRQRLARDVAVAPARIISLGRRRRPPVPRGSAPRGIVGSAPQRSGAQRRRRHQEPIDVGSSDPRGVVAAADFDDTLTACDEARVRSGCHIRRKSTEPARLLRYATAPIAPALPVAPEE